MHRTTATSLIVLSIILLFAGCMSTLQHSSYRAPGSSQGWKITAEKSMTGWVTITIDDSVVISDQLPLSGSKESKTEFRGHNVLAVLSTVMLGSKPKCILYIDGDVVARFEW